MAQLNGTMRRRFINRLAIGVLALLIVIPAIAGVVGVGIGSSKIESSVSLQKASQTNLPRKRLSALPALP
jgi:hypothetical protein